MVGSGIGREASKRMELEIKERPYLQATACFVRQVL